MRYRQDANTAAKMPSLLYNNKMKPTYRWLETEINISY
jgi:hypothetical protein